MLKVDQFIKEEVQNMLRKGFEGGTEKQMGGRPTSLRKAAKLMKIDRSVLTSDVKFLLSNFTEDEIVEIFR